MHQTTRRTPLSRHFSLSLSAFPAPTHLTHHPTAARKLRRRHRASDAACHARRCLAPTATSCHALTSCARACIYAMYVFMYISYVYVYTYYTRTHTHVCVHVHTYICACKYIIHTRARAGNTPAFCAATRGASPTLLSASDPSNPRA